MQPIPAHPLNIKWIKASLIGSLWASVEIIIGSFLHNMKIPFSGTILTCISVFLVISFFQIWKEKGVIWRAGLICALMKSISPSAVILGPMIGILTEAFLLEIMIRLTGSNLFAYLIGGALSVLSALHHKVIMLIILYGFNLVKLAEEMYYFIARQINYPDLNPRLLIWIIVSFHIILGLIGSFLGYLSGKKLLLKKLDSAFGEEILVKQENKDLFELKSDRDYSLLHLFIIISGTILSLASLNLFNLFAAMALSSLFLIYSLIRYSLIIKKFKKLSIWVQFAIIVISSSVLMKGVSGGINFAPQGFFIGLKMIVRAITIIVGFACLSVELRNPVIGNFLKKKGFNNLYMSLTVSFAVLPLLISEVEGNKNSKVNRKRKIESLMIKTLSLLRHFERIQPSEIIIEKKTSEKRATDYPNNKLKF